ncbi:MAG TPA: DUF1848 domain-containing protein [Bacillota bacterium]|nr:DUF1848 domain-containing protein [Bacillota bacterium]
MIISVSRRTDIPAFYSEWFYNRVREGYFIRVNPYNPAQRKRISLERQDVDAFVFWSKNPRPLLRYLPWLDDHGYPYYFLFTVNDYPELFEPRVPGLNRRVETFRLLSTMLGPERVIWRYDPIILSSLTTEQFHLETFARIAEMLTGYTKRVIISFLDSYPKVKRAFARLDPENSLQICEPQIGGGQTALLELSEGLSAIAAERQIAVYSCSEKLDLSQCQVNRGSCIDGILINKLFQLQLPLRKDPAQRPECGCVPAVDMGIYNTCEYLCSYCYANGHPEIVGRTVRGYNPDSPVLIEK